MRALAILIFAAAIAVAGCGVFDSEQVTLSYTVQPDSFIVAALYSAIRRPFGVPAMRVGYSLVMCSTCLRARSPDSSRRIVSSLMTAPWKCKAAAR